jgi:hypothetical protein
MAHLHGALAMSQIVSVRTEELAGPALGWAIESIEGASQSAAGQLQLPFTRQLDDLAVEQLIAKHGVWVERGAHFNWLADTKRDPFERQPGETRAIAVYRAVVAAKLGSTVSVPVELI